MIPGSLFLVSDTDIKMISIQKQKVVVIGHSSTLRLGVVRAVGELGCEVSVIVLTSFWPLTKKLKTKKPFDCYSKYISQIHYCHAEDGEKLIRILLDKCVDLEQKVILLPTSDFSTVTIDDNKKCLAPFFVFPHILDSAGSIRQWMDKVEQKKLAQEKGLDVPAYKVIDIRDHTYVIPEDIGYPCFTKALVSIEGGKQFFNRCNDQEALSQTLDAISSKTNVRILVEDYKKIETEYAVLGFSNGKDVIFPGIIHLVTQTISHFGVAMNGEILPVNGFETILNQFKSFVLQMGFVGIFDIDFYYSENKFYFGEMNLRFGGSGYAVTKSGVNLPAMLIRHFRGEDISRMKNRIDIRASYVNERMCEDDWCYGRISSEEYRRMVASADISFVRDEQDPMPQRIFEFIHFVHPLKKWLKRYLLH